MRSPRLQIDVHLLRNVTKRLAYVDRHSSPSVIAARGLFFGNESTNTLKMLHLQLDSCNYRLHCKAAPKESHDQMIILRRVPPVFCICSFTQTRAVHSTCASLNICKRKHTQKRHV